MVVKGEQEADDDVFIFELRHVVAAGNRRNSIFGSPSNQQTPGKLSATRQASNQTRLSASALCSTCQKLIEAARQKYCSDRRVTPDRFVDDNIMDIIVHPQSLV